MWGSVAKAQVCLTHAPSLACAGGGGRWRGDPARHPRGLLAGLLAAGRGYTDTSRSREAVARVLDRLVTKLEERARKVPAYLRWVGGSQQCSWRGVRVEVMRSSEHGCGRAAGRAMVLAPPMYHE
jgi:hypothetical protein